MFVKSGRRNKLFFPFRATMAGKRFC